MPSGNWGRPGTPRKPRTLNRRQRIFVDQYILTGVASQSALTAGYSPHSAAQIGYLLLQNLRVQASIAERTPVLRKELDVAGVFLGYQEMLEADPNEIIQHRRGACRFCWGKDHKRQHTPEEQRTRRAQFDHQAGTQPGDELVDGLQFDEEGGIGFDPRKEPHAGCPECFGEGESRVYVPDSRKLSPGARKLYAGVKKTKDGIEIKLHSQLDVREKIGKHLGMFVDKSEVDLKTSVTLQIIGGPPAPTEKDPEA